MILKFAYSDGSWLMFDKVARINYMDHAIVEGLMDLAEHDHLCENEDGITVPSKKLPKGITSPLVMTNTLLFSDDYNTSVASIVCFNTICHVLNDDGKFIRSISGQCKNSLDVEIKRCISKMKLRKKMIKELEKGKDYTKLSNKEKKEYDDCIGREEFNVLWPR